MNYINSFFKYVYFTRLGEEYTPVYPEWDWVQYVQDGDKVYLNKQDMLATILGRASYSGVYTIFIQTDKIEKWFVGPYGHGFDGSKIMTAIDGYVHTEIESADISIAIKVLSEKVKELENTVEYLKAGLL